jgi:UPF0755 protein
MKIGRTIFSTSIIKKTIVGLFLLIFLGILVGVVQFWKFVYRPNVRLNEPSAYLYIPTGSKFSDVCNILLKNGYVSNISSFEWVAERKGYPNHVKPGRYKISNDMSNKELVEMLRSGRQEPVRLVLKKFRTVYQLGGYLGRNLEPDSAQFVKILNDNSYLADYGMDNTTVLSLFIPNTYFVFWNITEKELLNRMYDEYKKFWNSERLKKAESMGFKPVEVVTLASIIQEESDVEEEYPVIAGVYINRLKRGIPLQADPTVKYANGDFKIKRILKKYLSISSPYNTYLNKGLPPGPICTPSPAAIDGVLNYRHHDYLYFCAKPDFSGRHVYARTLIEHNRNAQNYQKALDRLNIKK